MEGKILLFNKWDNEGVKIEDPGLVRYINIEKIIIPRTDGKFGTTAIHKKKIHIVERFMNKLMVPGHRGKKHKLTSGRCCGNTQTVYLAVKRAFELIEKKTNKNPLQVFVKGIENCAILEEVTAYRRGGMIVRKAVTTSPQRRLDLALRHLTQGIYKKTFKNKRKLHEVIADEIIAASNADPKCHAISEKNRIEKEAEGAR